MAYRDWHARSFTNAFCARACPLRVCRDVYRLRTQKRTTLYVSAMQPTKRGAWCRADRKKSYRLGDLSVLVVQLDSEGRFCKVSPSLLALLVQKCVLYWNYSANTDEALRRADAGGGRGAAC